MLFEDDQVEVHSFPLIHRIPCCGFLFREKPKPFRLDKNKLPENIPLQAIAKLKQGFDYKDEKTGISYLKEELTLPPRKSRSYAFCSDTTYDVGIVDIIRDVDLLYHEATFLAGKAQWAHLTFHSTTHEAAKIAKAANVGMLLIGHYSARYKELDQFLTEAKEVFENSMLAIEGETIEIEE